MQSAHPITAVGDSLSAMRCARSAEFPPRIQVIAHRGYSAAAPENSLRALVLAVAAEADFVELDVRLASDGIPVISHDADLQRLAGRPIRVAETPAAVLEAVASDAGASVLPLARLMTATLGRMPLLLDVKSTDPLVLEAIARTASAARFRADGLVLGLRDPALVEAASTWLPDAGILALHEPRAPIERFLERGVRLVRLWEAAATPAAVQELTDRGCSVWVTTGGRATGRPVGDATAESLAAVLASGAAGILVNDPDLALSVVRRAISDRRDLESALGRIEAEMQPVTDYADRQGVGENHCPRDRRRPAQGAEQMRLDGPLHPEQRPQPVQHIGRRVGVRRQQHLLHRLHRLQTVQE